MTDWSADPWFARHAWVAPRVGETRRSGFKSLRPHVFPAEPRTVPGALFRGRRIVAVRWRRSVPYAASPSSSRTWSDTFGRCNRAPDFTLPTSDSGSLTLSSLRGRPVFLEFMDIDCPHCINEARDVLPLLFQNYSSRVAFLSVDVNFIGAADTVDRVTAFKTTYGTNWPYAMDSGSVTLAYHVDSTPTMYVLDRNGVVAVPVIIGESPYATLAAALDRALVG